MKGFKRTGVLIAILIAIFVGITLTIDGIVKSGIEDSGSKLLKTEVEVDDLDVSIFGSSGSMDGFRVYNPESFSDEPAISLNEIELDISLSSILEDTIIINRIYVKEPKIFFEQKGAEVNLKILNNNISTDSEEESTPVIIRKFILEEGTIQISSELEKERNAETTLNRLELTNIGASGSNTTQDVLRQILDPIIRDALEKAIQSGLMDQLENAVEDAVDNVIDF